MDATRSDSQIEIEQQGYAAADWESEIEYQQQGYAQRDEPTAKHKRRKGISMHEGIAVWCDCCPCEAEPYWVEVGKEMGIDFSDYEEEE
jgi:hypothetical protein